MSLVEFAHIAKVVDIIFVKMFNSLQLLLVKNFIFQFQFFIKFFCLYFFRDDGSLSNFIIHAADFCYELPENVSYAEGLIYNQLFFSNKSKIFIGALMEPLSVGLYAVERGNIRMGQTVLILGCGPIGLTSLLACKAAGVSQIFVTDIQQQRLEIALKLGATKSFIATSENLVEQILEASSGLGVDATIDCSGSEPAIQAGLRATKAGGKFLSIGRGHNSKINIPNFFDLMDKEVTKTPRL